MEGVGAFVDTAVASLEANKDWVQMAFSGVGVVILAAVLRWIFRKRCSPESQAQQKSDLSQRNRQRMLDKVWHMWVEGVLEQSLYQVARIELGVSEAPEAIEHPWKLVAQQPERAPQMLRDGIPIVEVFELFSETLLILGAPGSGKTTLLLELARDLIDRAKKEAAHPIPVVFNLSSWALERKALTEWFVDELNQRYDTPRKVAQAWVENDEILPLIDGLDEVDEKRRDKCVEAINTFRIEHGLLPLVVCSRSKEYEKLSVRLRLPGAVKIQPLSRAQVDGYLERAGTALSGVCAAVGQDDTLWELLDTPLMLSILALAYQGRMASVARIARLKGGLQERRVALFDAYIEAMFKRRAAASPYTPEQTRHWMRWLAQAMVRHDQTVFYLERMQPDWLPKTQTRLQRISSGLVVGLVVGLFFWLVVGLDWEIQPVEAFHWSWSEARHGLVLGLVLGLVVGLFFWLVNGLFAGLFSGLFVGLFGGLIFGLVGGLDDGLVPDEIPTRTIPNEGIRRSLRNALFGGLVVGLVLGLVGGLMKGGTACIQHGVLRLLLWRYDYAPLWYVRLLDHAANLLFLRKVGGGYIFVHRMLMEHFAGLGEAADGEQDS